MPLLNIIVILLVLSIVCWIFQAYILPHVVEPFRTIIIIVLAVAAIIWLLSLIGVVGPMTLR